MRSALFVDFDNVFTGLSRLGPSYAEAFARQPTRWLDWLVQTLARPPGAEGSSQRRILVRRCYLNPEPYKRFRIGFSRAGFEIVDCPPMTAAGKTSTDIHMVLDIIDVLQSATRYDEFIVFSADADFTPVLRKLRREDRRTTVFAAGATSASYDASADLIIDAEAFLREALGVQDGEPDLAASSLDSVMAQAEAVVWRVMDRAEQPVPLPALTKALAVQVPELPLSDWAGKGTFLALLKSLPLDPLRIDRELNAMVDPRRMLRAAPAGPGALAAAGPFTAPLPASPSATPPAAPRPPVGFSPLHPPLPAGEAAGHGPMLEQLSRLIVEEVATAEAPIPAARLAQIARARLPGIEVHWLGHGSWKKLLDALSLPGVQIVWQALVGYALDPSRHSLPGLATEPAHPLRASVAPLLDAVGLPALKPAQYRAQLEGLAQALSLKPYSLGAVTQAMHEHCQRQQQPVSRDQCLRLLRTLVFHGFEPEAGPHGVEDLVALTCGVILSACAREGVKVEDSDRAALIGWMTEEG